MKSRWTPGHRVHLLENGEAYFPAVFDAIRNARTEVVLETFIVFEDKVGLELQQALLQAARNGARVHVLVDGFGSADLTPAYLAPLLRAGVKVRSFDPSVRFLGVRLNLLRRMHRKIVVVDGERAFVGGINFSADHLADFGPQAKQDYSVEIQGPLVQEIRRFALSQVGEGPEGRPERRPFRRRSGQAPDAAQRAAQDAPRAGTAEAIFVRRDNHEHRRDIERHYRAAIRSSRKRVIIANAYFFPGYRVLQALRRAARRGVDVVLILQGEPDMPIVKTAASWLYDHLQRDGVKIHEYCERPMHGKVAVVDDDWATVGSSNLDPLSLALNLEANLILRDREFAATLRGRLEHLMAHACKEVCVETTKRAPWWWPLQAMVLFPVLRHFPRWANWLPKHEPRVTPPPVGIAVPSGASAEESVNAR